MFYLTNWSRVWRADYKALLRSEFNKWEKIALYWVQYAFWENKRLLKEKKSVCVHIVTRKETDNKINGNRHFAVIHDICHWTVHKVPRIILHFSICMLCFILMVRQTFVKKVILLHKWFDDVVHFRTSIYS